MRVILDVIEGPNRGKSFSIDGRQVGLVGRALKCGDYCLSKDLEVSRAHALLEIDPPICRVRDLGSKNHTYINDRRVNNGELRDGDVLRLGPHTHLMMRVDAQGIGQVYEEEDIVVDD